MDSTLKRRREQFIEDNEGGTYLEVLQLTAIIQLSHILYTTLLLIFPSLACTRG